MPTAPHLTRSDVGVLTEGMTSDPSHANVKSGEIDYLQFRDLVTLAYEGACAITEVEIPEILDATLIERYRGASSLTVSNGILLRADVARLFDADLLAIEP